MRVEQFVLGLGKRGKPRVRRRAVGEGATPRARPTLAQGSWFDRHASTTICSPTSIWSALKIRSTSIVLDPLTAR